MDENFYGPAFVIYGKPPKPKPPAPPPEPEPPPPSDRVLSFHKRQEWQFAVARPVFTAGQRTGEWLVGSKRHKHDEPKRWMLMPNEDRAIEWCNRVNEYRTKDV